MNGWSDRHGIGRRGFVGSAIAALAAGSASSVFAQPSPSSPRMTVPVVDDLTVQILVDNSAFGPFLPNLALPGMTVDRFIGSSGNGGQMGPKALHAEFGLSVAARSRIGKSERRVIVDFGYTPEALSNNMALLGVDPARFDAAVLSHGHLDHYGGFAGLFGTAHPARPLPLYVGGEETFCERLVAIGNPPAMMGALDRAALTKAGFAVHISPAPEIVADHGFTSGIIPLHSFERAAIPTIMRPGVGCAKNELSPAKRTATQLPDDGEHELATCYAVKGLGLVVISCCSHRGVLNAVERARAISGIEEVHAVIGGFHLVRPRTEEEARRTALDLQKIDPRYIIPMHCTGEVFIAEATRLMPDKVVRPYVGSKFTFKA